MTQVTNSVNPEDDGDFSADAIGAEFGIPAPTAAAAPQAATSADETPEFMGSVGYMARARAMEGGTDGAGRLPEEFWGRTPLMRELRETARVNRNSPEALVNALLARVSAHVRPTVRVSTGLGAAALCWYCGLYGASGKGKGRAERTAEAVLPFAPMNDFVNIHLSTGQGITAAYGEMVTPDAGDDVMMAGTDPSNPWPDSTEAPQTRRGKKEKVFRQVYARGYVQETEGSLLKEMAAMKAGGALNPLLCKAWMSEAQGQSNASMELRRNLTADSYSLAMSLSVQPEPAAALLAMGSIGLPQRLSWSLANRSDEEIGDVASELVVAEEDYDFYDDDVEDGGHPGEEAPRALEVTVEHGTFPLGTWLASLDRVIVRMPRGARAEIARMVDRAESDKFASDALETHEPVWKAKAAALFALLHGSLVVRREHWEMAADLWEMSCGVRRYVQAFTEAQLAAEAAAKRAEAVRTNVESAEAVQEVTEGVHPVVKRTAEKIARRVQREAGGMLKVTHTVRKDCVSRADSRTWAARPGDSSLFGLAAEYAEEVGWIASSDSQTVLHLGAAADQIPGARRGKRIDS